jgi:putative ABC transport system permease protein
MTNSVVERTREIGIRMAMGAGRHEVLWLVIARGMALTLAGVALGAAGAWALTRFLTSMLYGVRPTDPTTFAVVSVALTATAFVASYIPAYRATKVDPMVALRYE